jgi:hypothetical protein
MPVHEVAFLQVLRALRLLLLLLDVQRRRERQRQRQCERVVRARVRVRVRVRVALLNRRRRRVRRVRLLQPVVRRERAARTEPGGTHVRAARDCEVELRVRLGRKAEARADADAGGDLLFVAVAVVFFSVFLLVFVVPLIGIVEDLLRAGEERGQVGRRARAAPVEGVFVDGRHAGDRRRRAPARGRYSLLALVTAAAVRARVRGDDDRARVREDYRRALI